MTNRNEMLQRNGYRRIASDAHAMQLLRREIKCEQRQVERAGGRHVVNTWRLMLIRPGNWFRFWRSVNPLHGQAKLMILKGD